MIKFTQTRGLLTLQVGNMMQETDGRGLTGLQAGGAIMWLTGDALADPLTQNYKMGRNKCFI